MIVRFFMMSVSITGTRIVQYYSAVVNLIIKNRICHNYNRLIISRDMFSIAPTMGPPGSPLTKKRQQSLSSSLPSQPLPSHRAITLSASNLTISIPQYFGTVTPLPSPCSSPPPTVPPSGYLEESKLALANAIDKRSTKTSTLSIDEDMRDMCHFYNLLGTDEREKFLLHLCTDYSTNHEAVAELASQRPDVRQVVNTVRWEEKLRQCLQPTHSWVLTQVSRLTGGVKFLVDLRHDLLMVQTSRPGNMPPHSEVAAASLRELDGQLKEFLSLWFTVGLLELARITWESSCNMLQKISEYEAVHPVRNWTDLKRRVGQNRRCFVFTHSCMPNEPLVVLHTFLTDSISSSMSGIVQNPLFETEVPENRVEIPEEVEDSATITAAVFYSITSTQKGLQGIELGNYLIKRVVQELQAELPSLCQFSSLSPIPGFVKWLNTLLAKAIRGEIQLFTDIEMSLLSQVMFSSKSLSPPRVHRTSRIVELAPEKPIVKDGICSPSVISSSTVAIFPSPQMSTGDGSVGGVQSAFSFPSVGGITGDGVSISLSTTATEGGSSDNHNNTTSTSSPHEKERSSGGSDDSEEEVPPVRVYQRLRQSLATNSWAQDEALRACLQKPFKRLCAYYLYTEKRRGYALNSVAHFHLKNGAVMWRLNYEADMTPRGLSNSCGMMVNYRYFLPDAENNSRHYQETMKIAADSSIVRLADAAADVMNNTRQQDTSPPVPA